MFGVTLSEVKEKIKQQAQLSDEQLNQKIREKMDALAGLVSEEGAAHILANELGIEVAKNEKELIISKLLPGMRGIEISGKVTRKFEVREFQTQSRAGKVGSVILADASGTVRVAFWNDQADCLGKFQEDDTLKLKNVYVRENRGTSEIHVNDSSKVFINPQGVQIEVADKPALKRKAIKDVVGGEQNIELLATVVSVFNPTFFSICSTCKKRVKQEEGVFRCAQDGTVEPLYSFVLNLILDDGTDTIRTVFWKEQTQHLTKKNETALLTYKDHPEQFEDIKTDLLGEMIKVSGRVKKNEMFERLELVVEQVQLNPDPKVELQRLEQQG